MGLALNKGFSSVGSPVCFVYFGGQRLSIRRGAEEYLHTYLSAQLTTDRIDQLVRAVRQNRGVSDSGEHYIAIDF